MKGVWRKIQPQNPWTLTRSGPVSAPTSNPALALIERRAQNSGPELCSLSIPQQQFLKPARREFTQQHCLQRAVSHFSWCSMKPTGHMLKAAGFSLPW